MKSFLALFSLLSLSALPIQAQDNQKLDSLLQAYTAQPNDTTKVYLGNLLVKNLIYTQPQKAFKYANEMITISKHLNYKEGMAMGNYGLGIYFANRHQIDSAEYFHKSSLQLYTEINDMSGVLTNHALLGDLYIKKAQYDKAMSYLNKNIDLYNNREHISYVKESDFKYIGSTYHTISTVYGVKGLLQLSLKNELIALKLYKKYAEELYVADALNSLGAIESDLGNTNQAIAYYEEALKTYQKFEDVFFECLTLENLGNQLRNAHRYKESFDYYFKALKISKENNFLGSESTIHNGLGATYKVLGDNKNSLRHFENSLQLFNEMENPTGIENTYLNLGKIHNTMNNPNTAVFHLNKGIAIADSNATIKSSLHLYQTRSESYQKMKKYKDALDDYLIHSKLKDSIFNETKLKQIEELRIIYDTEKKEQVITLQKKEIALLEEKEKNTALQRTISIAGLLVSLILLGLGYYGIRQKLKRNKAEKEKLDAEINFKQKELITQALHLAKKNETLENLKQKASILQTSETSQSGYQELISTINIDLQNDNNWENFARYFEEVHKDFNSKVAKKYPEITPNELRLMALLKMNLSSKEIANILNISIPGIKKARQRLRKKMNLSTTDSLENAVLAI